MSSCGITHHILRHIHATIPYCGVKAEYISEKGERGVGSELSNQLQVCRLTTTTHMHTNQTTRTQIHPSPQVDLQTREQHNTRTETIMHSHSKYQEHDHTHKHSHVKTCTSILRKATEGSQTQAKPTFTNTHLFTTHARTHTHTHTHTHTTKDLNTVVSASKSPEEDNNPTDAADEEAIIACASPAPATRTHNARRCGSRQSCALTPPALAKRFPTLSLPSPSPKLNWQLTIGIASA